MALPTYIKTRGLRERCFALNAFQAEKVLTEVCNIIDDPFEERNLSVTYDRKTVALGKRKRPLAGTELNALNTTRSTYVRLYKVALLVNKLAKPIVIGQFTKLKAGIINS